LLFSLNFSPSNCFFCFSCLHLNLNSLLCKLIRLFLAVNIMSLFVLLLVLCSWIIFERFSLNVKLLNARLSTLKFHYFVLIFKSYVTFQCNRHILV
jgi:hypothetical protein